MYNDAVQLRERFEKETSTQEKEQVKSKGKVKWIYLN